MGHLDVLFKVTELFIEFTLLSGYLKNSSTYVHHFFSEDV